MKNILISVFDSEGIEEVKFDSWVQTDRCMLRTLVMTVNEFIADCCEKIEKLKYHDFIAQKQSAFFKNLKENLLPGEFLVCLDFAENYSFVVQNSTQSFHWNNDQATIFTAIAYYKDNNNDVKHKSIATISNNLKHDTCAVYNYQIIIINYLKHNFNIQKIYYFTDGASQHFKNKSNFSNLQNHETDFNISAEWHFHATAHGKGGCDGIGANLKRGAAKASLQRLSQNHILTVDSLYKWSYIMEYYGKYYLINTANLKKKS